MVKTILLSKFDKYVKRLIKRVCENQSNKSNNIIINKHYI